MFEPSYETPHSSDIACRELLIHTMLPVLSATTAVSNFDCSRAYICHGAKPIAAPTALLEHARPASVHANFGRPSQVRRKPAQPSTHRSAACTFIRRG
jgi:hypothetical protein